MEKFYKRTEHIEAVQFNGENTQQIIDSVDKAWLACGDHTEIILSVPISRELRRARVGDWIIKKENGRYDVLSNSEFEFWYFKMPKGE